MPDEISHILWTYLVLKHPGLKNRKEFTGKRNTAATYFFTIFPDIGNLILIILAFWVTYSNGLPMVFWYQSETMCPEVYDIFMGSGKNIYYIFHSYITLAVLLGLFYLLSKRIYPPLLLGAGLHIALDILTHKDATALKPFYPAIDARVNGLLHWGSFEFYVIEIIIFILYTLWLMKIKTKKEKIINKS